MKLSDQFCTIEQSLKLIELGVKYEGRFMHAKFREFIEGKEWEAICPISYSSSFCSQEQISPAFSVAELGLMLPPFFPSFVQDVPLFSHCVNYRVDIFPLLDSGSQFETVPAHIQNKELIPISTGKTEAQSRANMLIFLLENNFISPEEVNERLNKN
jgi:hypothetical protein